MQLNHQDPWELMSSLRRGVDRAIRVDRRSPRDAFVPGVDIREEAERFVVLADVPGVDPAAIEITIDADLLTVSGNREPAPMAEGAAVQRAERPHGHFERCFRLPETAAKDGFEADYRNGVLTISIPKAEEAVPYRIEVTAN
ncbi:MAG: Hsp20/alpha crystallin family protein [Gammaproteobacteria bacterium]|jgi:HSP20 family protein